MMIIAIRIALKSSPQTRNLGWDLIFSSCSTTLKTPLLLTREKWRDAQQDCLLVQSLEQSDDHLGDGGGFPRRVQTCLHLPHAGQHQILRGMWALFSVCDFGIIYYRIRLRLLRRPYPHPRKCFGFRPLFFKAYLELVTLTLTLGYH